MSLPIDALRGAFESALGDGALVLSAPTGTGKSTQVPRWCAQQGPVLIVEPRRVACRALAARVAELDGVALGDAVGYRVRDDDRASAKTRALFVTPGIALRMLASARDLASFPIVIIDEFHERSLDTDLILALLRERPAGTLVVMSATLDGDALATELGGRHLSAEGRLHSVDIHYAAGDGLLPEARGLDERIARAVSSEAVANAPGDVLVFLPGKAEIAAVERRLARREDLEVLPLHGGLGLDAQSRVFTPARRRRVVLATNVAETSLTIPGIGVVIDSGLVRRTRYHAGRGFLTLAPIAEDSAAQRAGRAGRTGPGLCLRLWSSAARLDARTPPEIHRESLVPLVLAAAACGARVDALPFVDAPKAHALDAAREELQALGALGPEDRLTERGRALFGLPLDAALGRLLVEAEGGPLLGDIIDLISVLSVGRPLFRGPRPELAEDDLRESGCDVAACIHALRKGRAREHGLDSYTLEEARRVSRRLRKAYGLPARADSAPAPRRALAAIALAADPRCAYITRRRKRGRREEIAFGNGGTELSLGRESAVRAEEVDAIAVLDTRALGLGRRDTQLIATCAMPVKLAWLVDAGLGRDRLADAQWARGQLVARVERVYARRVLDTREEEPEGAWAREAIAELVLAGRLLAEVGGPLRERVETAALAQRLIASGRLDAARYGDVPATAIAASAQVWLLARLEELGVESAADLELLSDEDLLPPPLPERLRERVAHDFPRHLNLGDARYRVDYDLPGREVVLHKISGQRKALPNLRWLPAWKGLRVQVEDRGQRRLLRDR